MSQPGPSSGRIDVHAHFVPPVLREALADTSRFAMPVRAPEWTPQIALDVMDRHGIAAMLGSISVPGTHHGDDARARDLSRRCNDFAADVVARHSKRFGAFAALPLPDVGGAITEIEHALDTLTLDGVGMFTSYGGKNLGHPDFDPVMEALNARRAVVFVHPTAHPSASHVDPGLPPFMIEYPFDTTRAAVNLMLSTAMDRFPDVRFILSHAGGTLPFLAWRVAELGARLVASKELRNRYQVPLFDALGGDITPEAVMERIGRFWVDTANAAGPAVFGALDQTTPPDRVLFGTDWPYVPEKIVEVSAKDVDRSLPDPALRADVNRENALKLFPGLA